MVGGSEGIGTISLSRLNFFLNASLSDSPLSIRQLGICNKDDGFSIFIPWPLGSTSADPLPPVSVQPIPDTNTKWLKT